MNIHDGRKIKNGFFLIDPVPAYDPSKRPFNLILFWHNNRKNIKKFLLFILIIVILFFPIWSGSLIGNWIKDFIGTITNIVKTI